MKPEARSATSSTVSANFNSIKVRLKPEISQIQISPSTTFQFHKGTIETLKGLTLKCSVAPFQFHKGTIETGENVRSDNKTLIFQFHKGTIETRYVKGRQAYKHWALQIQSYKK